MLSSGFLHCLFGDQTYVVLLNLWIFWRIIFHEFLGGSLPGLGQYALHKQEQLQQAGGEIQVGKFEKSRLGTLRNTRCKCKSSHTKLNLMQPKQIPASGKYVNIVLLKNNQFYFQGWVSKLFPFLRPVNMRGGMCTVQSLSLCQRDPLDSIQTPGISGMSKKLLTQPTLWWKINMKNWGKYCCGGLL